MAEETKEQKQKRLETEAAKFYPKQKLEILKKEGTALDRKGKLREKYAAERRRKKEQE